MDLRSCVLLLEESRSGIKVQLIGSGCQAPVEFSGRKRCCRLSGIMSEEQVARLTSVLRSAIRLSEYTNRDLERKLGFSGGYLSRLFGGQIDIKVSHILTVLEIIG